MIYKTGIVVLAALFLLGCSSNEFAASDSQVHTHSMEEAVAHPHTTFEIPSGELVPTVSITVTHDDISGYNVYAPTENFEWSPLEVNKADEIGTGHAHLYVDGIKIARMYSPYYHIAALTPGEHLVRVELNTNQHHVYYHNNTSIGAQSTVLVDHTH